MSWVAILMGSESDWPTMQATTGVLEELQVKFEVKVTSAHRTPAATQEYVADAEARGCRVFICAAGMAAHLAGAVAAHTQRPVIGVPIDSGPLQGFDAAHTMRKCLAAFRWRPWPLVRLVRKMLGILQPKCWPRQMRICTIES